MRPKVKSENSLNFWTKHLKAAKNMLHGCNFRENIHS